MILTVHVPEWELEEDGRILRVGENVRSWLTFRAERSVVPAERINVIQGVAVPLSDWPGAEHGMHPVQINLDGGVLYWDAPKRFEEAVQLTGTVSSNNVDAPEGFPETTGLVRRLRMEWQDFTKGAQGVWQSKGDSARYEEVATTYLPNHETGGAIHPDVEVEMERQAQAAYERELLAGRLKRGDPFEITLAFASPTPYDPPGTTRTRWTGVLIDLEIGTSPER